MKRFCWLLLVMVIAGCTRTAPPPKSGTVKVDSPKKKPMRRVIEQPANVDPFLETPVVARIAGDVKTVNVDIGDEVKAGVPIAELSVPEMLKELDGKKALVKQAKADVDQANAALEAAEAHILTAKALVKEAEAAVGRTESNVKRWESEHLRVDGLYKSKIVEKQILDETLNQLESARAGRDEAKAKVDSTKAHAKEDEAKRNKAKADVAAAESRVAVAKAKEEELKANVDYRFIRPAFDGVVTRRNIHPGHYVQPNASGGAAVLFVIAQTSKLRIWADIPETEAAYIKDDLKATILVPAMPGLKFQEKIARTNSAHERGSRTLRVEFDHDNAKTKVRPGMYANVVFDIDLGERHALPALAIFTHIDQPCCWRVEDGKAVRTPLKLGMRSGQDVEVIEKKIGDAWSKIDGKEQVIVTNLGVVSEGKEVRIENK